MSCIMPSIMPAIIKGRNKEQCIVKQFIATCKYAGMPTLEDKCTPLHFQIAPRGKPPVTDPLGSIDPGTLARTLSLDLARN